MSRSPKQLLFNSRFDAAKRNIASELRSLEHKVKAAREALAKGDPLDEHLIQNSSGLATLIGRYNLCLELAPVMEEP